MTRINSAIPPRCLTDEHLLAEHREIKRLPYCLHRAVACGSVRRIPQRFTLGSGHVLFFIDKMAFARQRYSELHAECLRRQFEVTDYAANFADIPDGFGGGHTPTADERDLLTARIAERIMASRKQTWHYNRQPITKQQAVELLTNN